MNPEGCFAGRQSPAACGRPSDSMRARHLSSRPPWWPPSSLRRMSCNARLLGPSINARQRRPLGGTPEQYSSPQRSPVESSYFARRASPPSAQAEFCAGADLFTSTGAQQTAVDKMIGACARSSQAAGSLGAGTRSGDHRERPRARCRGQLRFFTRAGGGAGELRSPAQAQGRQTTGAFADPATVAVTVRVPRQNMSGFIHGTASGSCQPKQGAAACARGVHLDRLLAIRLARGTTDCAERSARGSRGAAASLSRHR